MSDEGDFCLDRNAKERKEWMPLMQTSASSTLVGDIRFYNEVCITNLTHQLLNSNSVVKLKALLLTSGLESIPLQQKRVPNTSSP